jgi:hypothetical protein
MSVLRHYWLPRYREAAILPQRPETFGGLRAANAIAYAAIKIFASFIATYLTPGCDCPKAPHEVVLVRYPPCQVARKRRATATIRQSVSTVFVCLGGEGLSVCGYT